MTDSVKSKPAPDFRGGFSCARDSGARAGCLPSLRSPLRGNAPPGRLYRIRAAGSWACRPASLARRELSLQLMLAPVHPFFSIRMFLRLCMLLPLVVAGLWGCGPTALHLDRAKTRPWTPIENATCLQLIDETPLVIEPGVEDGWAPLARHGIPLDALFERGTFAYRRYEDPCAHGLSRSVRLLIRRQGVTVDSVRFWNLKSPYVGVSSPVRTSPTTMACR